MRVTIRQPRYCQARTKKIFDSGDEKYFVLLSHHLMEAEAQWKLFQLIILNIGSHPPSIAPSLHITHTVNTIHVFSHQTSSTAPVWTFGIIVIMQVDCCWYIEKLALVWQISFEMSRITLHSGRESAGHFTTSIRLEWHFWPLLKRIGMCEGLKCSECQQLWDQDSCVCQSGGGGLGWPAPEEVTVSGWEVICSTEQWDQEH